MHRTFGTTGIPSAVPTATDASPATRRPVHSPPFAGLRLGGTPPSATPPAILGSASLPADSSDKTNYHNPYAYQKKGTD